MFLGFSFNQTWIQPQEDLNFLRNRRTQLFEKNLQKIDSLEVWIRYLKKTLESLVFLGFEQTWRNPS